MRIFDYVIVSIFICKHLNEISDGNYYVEVKGHRYKIHPTENIILRKRIPPASLRTQYQVQNETQIRKNQKVIKNDNDELIVKNYPKNKHPIIQQQKNNLPKCTSCKQNTWLEFDKRYYFTNCEYVINKQKHQIDKNIRRQDHNFSTRLNYANKKIREIFINMVNTNYITTEDMINKLQSLKGKIKLKFYKNIGNYYQEMINKNFQTQQDPCSKNAEGISKIYHKVLLLMKFLQTKPQIKNMNMNYYDLYYTVIKTRDEKRDIDIQFENKYNDYINFNDFITPDHYIGRKNDNVMLK